MVTPVLSVTLVNQRGEITRLGGLFDEFAATHGLVADDIAAVHLVLDEIVMNVIRHAHDDEARHDIGVVITLDGRVIEIQVEDDGRPFNPLDQPEPNLQLPLEVRPIGGLGIHIVRMTVDEMTYRREGGRNILTLRKTMAI